MTLASASSKKIRIAHISDLHFGTVTAEVEQAVLRALQDLKLDLIIASGDITQRARRSQFEAARAFMDRLQPVPLVSIPGNHDIPLFNLFDRIFRPYHGYRHFFKGTLDACFSFSGVEVLVLNSTKNYRHVQGSLTLDKLRKDLSLFSADSLLRVVAFHHPMDCLKKSDEVNLLKNHRAAMNLFVEHRVDLILGGHIHDPVTRTSQLRYPEVSLPMILSVAGTTTSWRVRSGAPNSFNIYDIHLQGSLCVDYRRHVLMPSGHFEVGEEKTFHRSEATGWH